MEGSEEETKAWLSYGPSLSRPHRAGTSGRDRSKGSDPPLFLAHLPLQGLGPQSHGFLDELAPRGIAELRPLDEAIYSREQLFGQLNRLPSPSAPVDQASFALS